MIIRSAPPCSMNLALMPVPAPPAIIGWPLRRVASSRSTTSFRLYGFPFPVHGFGIKRITVQLLPPNLPGTRGHCYTEGHSPSFPKAFEGLEGYGGFKKTDLVRFCRGKARKNWTFSVQTILF